MVWRAPQLTVLWQKMFWVTSWECWCDPWRSYNPNGDSLRYDFLFGVFYLSATVIGEACSDASAISNDVELESKSCLASGLLQPWRFRSSGTWGSVKQMKALQYFRISEAAHPITKGQIPKDLDLQWEPQISHLRTLWSDGPRTLVHIITEWGFDTGEWNENFNGLLPANLAQLGLVQLCYFSL